MFIVLVVVLCVFVGLAAIWSARRSRRPEANPPVVTSTAEPDAGRGVPPAAARYAPRVLLLVGEEHAAAVQGALTLPSVRLTSATRLVEEAARSLAAVAIVDGDLVSQVEGRLGDVPLVALVDADPQSSLRSIVQTLSCASVASVIVAATLETPAGRKHLAHLMRRLTSDPSHDLLGASSMGRMAKIAQASHRTARLERMAEYFTQSAISARAIGAIHDVAEELVMNALYNAPAEAGYFAQAVSRTVDVTLPASRACEISYGVDGTDVFVRVRDSFGSLDRARVLDVLARCSSSEVSIDESRGGAGLGLWRIFSAASSVAITVIPDHLTDIVVRIPINGARGGRALMGVHLFFSPRVDDDPYLLDQQSSLVDRSITMVHA